MASKCQDDIKKKTYNEYVLRMKAITSLIGDKLASVVIPNNIKRVWKEYTRASESVVHKAHYLYVTCF